MLEPFAAEPDPAFYVPRPASERAVATVRSTLEQRTASVVVLYGPPGIGKSVVLDQVALGVAPPTVCLRMDHAGLSLEDICSWLARELEALAVDAGHSRSWSERMRDVLSRKHSDRRDPQAELIQQVQSLQRHGGRVIALIDEADEITATTLRGLAEVVALCARGLRVCVATSSEAEFAGLSALVEIVRYEDPLSESETAEYIQTRLQRAHASVALRARLDPPRLRRLHRFSGGNPRRLHAELSLIRIELGADLAEPAAPALGRPPLRARPPIPEPDRIAALAHGSSRSEVPGRTPVGRDPLASPVARAPGAPAGAPPRPAAPGSRPDVAPRPRVDAPPPVTQPAPAESDRISRPVEAPATPAVAVPGSVHPRSLPAEPAARRPPVARPQPAAEAASAPAKQPAAASPRRWPWSAATWAALAAAAGSVAWLAISGLEDEPGGDRSLVPRELRGEAGPEDAPAVPPLSITIPVNINADPWANIWIDGQAAGETPLGDVPLTPGEHVFRAELPNGRIVERTVEISQSQRWVYFE